LKRRFYRVFFNEAEQIGKPGSVLNESIIIYLDPPLPAGSRDLTRKLDGPPNTFLCGLAPDGVYLAGLSPNRRCALTAPFHPYLPEGRRFISVALSLRSPSPAVSRHPALWCPDFPQTVPFGNPLAMIQFTPLAIIKTVRATLLYDESRVSSVVFATVFLFFW
jgi:hypothetical protein